MNFHIDRDTTIEDIIDFIDDNKDIIESNDPIDLETWRITNTVLLCEASSIGHIAIVKILYENGYCYSDLRKYNRIYSAIEEASINGYVEIVKYFIKECNFKLDACLYYAIEYGWVDILDYLLTLNIDINTKFSNPLAQACKQCNIDIIDRLLKAGADPNIIIKDRIYNTPFEAAICSKRLDIVILFIIHGANFNYASNKICYPLTIACKNGLVDIADFLIGLGCDINFYNESWYSPLEYAIKNCDNNMIKLLHNKLNAK